MIFESVNIVNFRSSDNQ